MFAYILRSLAQGVLVMLTVAFIAFAMFRYVGDPIANMLGQEATLQDRDELRAKLGLDQPFPIQFANYVGNVLKGDLGVSYRQARPVLSLMAERLPATLELALLSALLAVAVGVPLGVYTAIRRDGWLSHTIMSVSLIGVSLPTFLIGIGLIFLFGVYLKWLPFPGRGDVVKLGWWSTGLLTERGRLALVMPVLTLSLFQLTLIMRLVRAEMLETMRTEYVRFARARGVPENRIQFRHALRNTMIPVVTITGLQLGSVVAFSIVTETVFQWPGLGALFVNAVQFADVPVMAAYLMFVALVFVIVSLVTDLTYFALDPRLRGVAKVAR
ncbi:MAG: ABC transporter permease [Beijerinckiaceae bacterium]